MGSHSSPPGTDRGTLLLASPSSVPLGGGSNGFAAWKPFVSLLIASPGPTERKVPSWLTVSSCLIGPLSLNPMSVQCSCAYSWLQQRAGPAGFTQLCWSWGQLAAARGATGIPARNHPGHPRLPSVTKSIQGCLSSWFGVSQQAAGGWRVPVVIFGVGLSPGKVGVPAGAGFEPWEGRGANCWSLRVGDAFSPMGCLWEP